MVTLPYAYMTYIVSPLAGMGGAYRGGRLPTSCFTLSWEWDLKEVAISFFKSQ